MHVYIFSILWWTAKDVCVKITNRTTRFFSLIFTGRAYALRMHSAVYALVRYLFVCPVSIHRTPVLSIAEPTVPPSDEYRKKSLG